MQYYLDSADTRAIKTYLTPYNLAGVTTNPTILKNDGTSLNAVARAVPEDKRLFCQVVARDTDGMIADTKALMALHPGMSVKIPATPEGLRAIARLREENISVLATAIYGVQQAVMAAACGAAWVAPYVNRISDLGQDGAEVACAIQKIFDLNKTPCTVLAASFKNLEQLTRVMTGGVRAVTLSADLMEKITQNPSAIAAEQVFRDDWKTFTGSAGLGL